MSSYNTSYSFKLGGVKLRADIDNSLLAESWLGAVDPLPKKLLHYHPMHELFFVFDEPLTITTAEEVQEFRNSIVCVPPFVEHFSNRRTDYRFLFSFDTANSPEGGLADFMRRSFSGKEVFSLGELSGDVRAYLDELYKLSEKKGGDLERELAASVLKLLFYHVYSARRAEQEPIPHSESYLITIEQIVNEYSHNPEADIDLGFVADALHLSKKQTSRIIYKYFKKPFSALKLDKRLEYARYLLISTDLPISDIAAKAGFASENYFYSTFKKKFGKTPLSYRKSAAGK